MRYLGRKSELKLALREVRDRETGMALNAAPPGDRGGAGGAASAELARELADDDAEPSTRRCPASPSRAGSLHLITQLRRAIEDVFLGMGYEVYDGREVETVWHNFDALNQPEAHPSRAPRDTFYFDANTLLRTHTSPSQIRAMQAQEPPIYLVSLGRAYRRDTLDATHTPIFHQVEGLAVDRGITLADLRGTIELFASAIFGPSARCGCGRATSPSPSRRSSSTSPATSATAQGCPVCKHSGWIEMGGAGMVDPDVFEAVGYDPEEWTGFAFGLGIERIALLRHGLPDLRLFWENDLRMTEAVLMRVPCRWLREYVDFDWPVEELAREARLHELRGRPGRPARRRRLDGNLGRFLVGKVVEAGKHPNADRLQLCRVDVGEGEPRQIVCGAWNFGAGATVAVALPGALLPGAEQPLGEAKLRGETLARDDPLRARARARRRPQRDHGAGRTGSSPGRRSPTSCRCGDRCSRSRPASTGRTCVGLRHRAGGRRR